MKNLTLTITMGVLVTGALIGCDAQRWVGSVTERMPVAPETAEEVRLSPAFSQSGRVEARLLNPIGPMPAPRAPHR